MKRKNLLEKLGTMLQPEARKKEEAQADYKIADDYYTECLKCQPGNQDCKEGQRRVKWEH